MWIRYYGIFKENGIISISKFSLNLFYMGGKQTHKKSETQGSALRILGAVFFGFLLGSIIRAIVNFTVPTVLMRIKNIRLEDAQNIYNSSIFVNILLGVAIVFLLRPLPDFWPREAVFSSAF